MYKCGSVPLYPQWCEECTRLGIQLQGFPYYRAEHQLPGIATCLIHEIVLCYGCEECGPNPVRKRGLDLPGYCRCGRTLRPLRLFKAAPENIEIHNWLARESAYLLTAEMPAQAISAHDLRKVFGKHGFLNGSLVDPGAIASALDRRFGAEFLAWLGYPAWTERRPSPWVRKFLLPSRGGRTRSTIQYLLFAGIITDKVQTFIDELTVADAETDVAGDLGDEAIHSDRQDFEESLRKNGWRISKTAAALGYSPFRTAIKARDCKINVPLVPRMRKTIGEANLARIKQELSTGVSKQQIRSKYKLSEWALQLVELDDLSIAELRKASERNARRDFYRTDLAQAISHNGIDTRHALHRLRPATYEFLVARDREWLDEHLPRLKRAPEREVHRRTEK